MRLWSLHPQYLDPKGLVALWREGLLAQAVLQGKTKGYRHHPQLSRFRSQASPVCLIAQYLRAVHTEAVERGYRFDAGKITSGASGMRLDVSQGQLEFEWRHLMTKLGNRAPQWRDELAATRFPLPHPLFRVVPGPIADWERP